MSNKRQKVKEEFAKSFPQLASKKGGLEPISRWIKANRALLEEAALERAAANTSVLTPSTRPLPAALTKERILAIADSLNLNVEARNALELRLAQLPN